MKALAHFFSFVLSPLLMPFYGFCMLFFYSYLYIFPTPFKLFMAGGVLFFTAILPAFAILWMYKAGRVKSLGLNDREDRLVPYLINIFGYVLCLVFLYLKNFPFWVMAFMVGCIGSVLTAMFVNRRWKISAHLTGIGGLIGLAFGIASIQMTFPIILFSVLILLAGILGTSRIALGRHTFWQVVTGTFNGFLWVFGAIILTSLFVNTLTI